MIFTIDNPIEFKKFAESCESHRYRLYFDYQEKNYWLRPTKSSKHLDTVKFTGKMENELLKFLEEKFKLIKVAEVTFIKE